MQSFKIATAPVVRVFDPDTLATCRKMGVALPSHSLVFKNFRFARLFFVPMRRECRSFDFVALSVVEIFNPDTLNESATPSATPDLEAFKLRSVVGTRRTYN